MTDLTAPPVRATTVYRLQFTACRV